MKSVIIPTITTSNAHIYREQIERVSKFASRLHVDFADGDFAPTKLVEPTAAWIPGGIEVDLHVMYRRPEHEIENLIALRPSLIVLHAESEGNVIGLLREIKGAGIRAGVALLQNTQPEEFANEIEESDHVLIFGGSLGYHGGEADLKMLEKVTRIADINPQAELGWDGGANDQNTGRLIHAGIGAINVGSFIQKADDPQAAYVTIKSVINH